MKYNYSKLRGRIKERYDTQADFAKAINLSTVSLSSKLNNKVFWDQGEMHRAGELLDIPKEELYDYFFSKLT